MDFMDKIREQDEICEEIRAKYDCFKEKYEEQQKYVARLEGVVIEERNDRKKSEEEAVELLLQIKKGHDKQVSELRRTFESEIKLLQSLLEESKSKSLCNNGKENKSVSGDAKRELDKVKKELKDSKDCFNKVCNRDIP